MKKLLITNISLIKDSNTLNVLEQKSLGLCKTNLINEEILKPNFKSGNCVNHLTNKHDDFWKSSNNKSILCDFMKCLEEIREERNLLTMLEKIKNRNDRVLLVFLSLCTKKSKHSTRGISPITKCI